MKELLLILVALMAFSCGSSPKKIEKKQDEFDQLSNSQFSNNSKKLYSFEDDFLDKELSSEDNVLYSESLGKSNRNELDDVDDIDSPLVKALVACYREDFRKADVLFDQTLKEYRLNPIYWTQVGNCFLKKGSQRKALLYYNKAKELKKGYAPPVNNIGVLLERKGYPEKALKAYEEAMRLASFSLTPLFNNAQLFTKYSLTLEAKSLLESLKNLEQDDQDTLSSLAYVELTSGNFTAAVDSYEKINRRALLKNPEVGVNYAYALIMSGNKRKAKKILKSLNDTKNTELAEYIIQIKRLL